MERLRKLATVVSKAMRNCLSHKLHEVSLMLSELKDASTDDQKSVAIQKLLLLTSKASSGSDMIVLEGRIVLQSATLQERFNSDVKTLLTEMLYLEAAGVLEHGHPDCKLPLPGLYCLTSQNDNLGADIMIHDTDFWLVTLCHEAIRRNNPAFVENNCFVMPTGGSENDLLDASPACLPSGMASS